jgi:hypothetical protein
MEDCCSCPAVSVELNRLRTTHDWSFNPSVMLANALTAFILNLVSSGLGQQRTCQRGCLGRCGQPSSRVASRHSSKRRKCPLPLPPRSA